MAIDTPGQYDKYGSPGSPLRELAILGDVEKQSGSPYKSYVAILSQPDLENVFGNPIAIVLNPNDANYLGDIAWTSTEDEAVYKGTLIGAFTPNRVYINASINYINTSIDNVLPAQGDVNNIYFTTQLLNSGYAFTGNGIFIEVRVYQN